MKESFIDILKWCKRYISLTLIAIVAFIIFVLFFNDNSIMKSFEYNNKIDMLNAQIKENNDSLRHYNTLLNRLNTDPETMERIVREHYHMQRANEDVYIFEENKDLE